ncbi:hypothetical protein DFA_08896 [Cavenderia fasciculata]|uniref:Uncharacterized protein n=1 Tax=Cavenderia fasciculata TaxID=261658 RepID=F4Q4U9_CACFS|nr:uncharacterized protein DFA_08896 [Cavenderia fasciculata]EGG17895.1 hypothetical protein DFA_08896 [Cavenderia fasciculata]|eukprot:XP_004356379.1 hypothetical protein DFA_08896 [Cavenderia fasciculata]
MWLFNSFKNTQPTTTINKNIINNNQLGLPDYIVKKILRCLQHSIAPCLHDSLEDNGGDIDLSRNAYTLYDGRMNVHSILHLSLVCSYWFRIIIPSSMDRYTYVLPSIAVQEQDHIKLFGKNVIARYKRSPLQQFNQSLQQYLRNNNIVIDSGNNSGNKVESLKIYISLEYRQSMDTPPLSVNSIMNYDASVAALSVNLRRLTLYNIEFNDTLLNLSKCTRLERLVIYPVGVWRANYSDILLALLKQTPTLTDLAIKCRSTEMTAQCDKDTSALGQLQKFTFIGSPTDQLRGLMTPCAFKSMSNLVDLKLKFNGLIAFNSRLRPSAMIQAIPSLAKMERLHLENFISPAETDTNIEESVSSAQGFTYLPWHALSSLTHLYIERLLGTYTRRQVNHLLHDVRHITTLQSLAIKSIEMIHPPTLISTLDALPYLTYFKYATTPRMDCEQESGTMIVHSSDTSISLAILQYLETNQTIQRFSFTLDNEYGPSVYPFRALFNHYQDNSTSQLHKSNYYISDEFTQLECKVKDLQNGLTNLIKNSESMQRISLSSNIGRISSEDLEVDRQKLGTNLELLSPQFLNTLVRLIDCNLSSDSKVNPRSKLQFIKIDKCLTFNHNHDDDEDKDNNNNINNNNNIKNNRKNYNNNNNQKIKLVPKKKVHKSNNFWKWEMKRIVKEDANQFKRIGPHHQDVQFIAQAQILSNLLVNSLYISNNTNEEEAVGQKMTNNNNINKSIQPIQNNQVNVPDYILKYIISLLQQPSTTCSNNNNNNNSSEHLVSLTPPPLKKFNQYVNYLYLSLVCSYWFRYIIPVSVKSFRYIIPNTSVSYLVGKVGLRYPKSPLTLFNQSLQLYTNNHKNNNNNNKYTSNQIERLKVFVECEDIKLPMSLEPILHPSSSLDAVSHSLRRLTLYNDLAIKCTSIDRVEATYDKRHIASLGHLKKFTYVGSPSDMMAGVLSERHLDQLTDLTIKINRGVYPVSNQWSLVLANKEQLKTLRLCHWVVLDQERDALKLTKSSLSTLTSLHINSLFPGYTQSSVNHLLSNIQMLKSLSFLAIKSIRYIDSDNLITTIDSLSPQLSHFKFETTPLFDQEGDQRIESNNNNNNHKIKRFTFTLEKDVIEEIRPSQLQLEQQNQKYEITFQAICQSISLLIINSQSIRELTINSKYPNANFKDSQSIRDLLSSSSPSFVNDPPKQQLSIIKFDKSIMVSLHQTTGLNMQVSVVPINKIPSDDDWKLKIQGSIKVYAPYSKYHHIQNNQTCLPNLILKNILELLQYSSSCNLTTPTTTTTTSSRSASDEIKDNRSYIHIFNERSNYLMIGMVCSYWFKQIIPTSIRSIRYRVPICTDQDTSAMTLFGKKFITKYKRSPLQLYLQSLQSHFNITTNQNNDNQNNNDHQNNCNNNIFNNLESVKIYIPTHRNTNIKVEQYLNSLDAIMDIKSSLGSMMNIGRLTLYNVDLNEMIWNLSHCHRLERLVIYPMGTRWTAQHNHILMTLLLKTPSIQDLAIKSLNIEFGTPLVGDCSGLMNIVKFTYVGRTHLSESGLVSKKTFSQLGNLEHLKIKLNTSPQNGYPSWLEVLPSKSKLKSLYLSHFLNPETTSLEGFTNLTRLYIDRDGSPGGGGESLASTPQRVFDQIAIDYQTLISVIDSLPLLNHLKFSVLVPNSIFFSPNNPELLMKYLETNHTIKRFSYSLEAEDSVSRQHPSMVEYHDNVDNGIEHLLDYTKSNAKLIERAIAKSQQCLLSLIQNSETLETISFSSLVDSLEKKNNTINDRIVTKEFMSKVLNAKKNPKSCLSLIKVDSCLSIIDNDDHNKNNQVISICPKKRIHHLNDQYRWEMEKTLKQNINHFKKHMELELIEQMLQEISLSAVEMV